MFESARQILRVGREAGPEEVRQAYVRLLRRYPPEHFPAKFAALDQAYRQLTLDDDTVDAFFRQMTLIRSPLEFAGLLWGDAEELRPPAFDLNDLEPLVRAGAGQAELDGILADLDISDIEWRGLK
jgi:curved DNA-binding protein CbpA